MQFQGNEGGVVLFLLLYLYSTGAAVHSLTKDVIILRFATLRLVLVEL